jgi:hypothetical protein
LYYPILAAIITPSSGDSFILSIANVL